MWVKIIHFNPFETLDDQTPAPLGLMKRSNTVTDNMFFAISTGEEFCLSTVGLKRAI